MLSCPYPNCEHKGEIITNSHCKTDHKMSRDEVFRLYGKPVPLKQRDKFLMGKKLSLVRGQKKY